MLVFSSLNETDSSPAMEALAEKIMPMYSQSSDEIMMNPLLFAKVKQVYDRRNELNLNASQLRAVELAYKQFVRSGALLGEAEKQQLLKINTELTDLYLKFNKNLLDDTNAFSIVIDNADELSGIPAGNVALAAEEAASRGMNGKWVFTLHAPSRLPVLQYAYNRALRQKMYEGYTNLASQGKNDNKPVINSILSKKVGTRTAVTVFLCPIW